MQQFFLGKVSSCKVLIGSQIPVSRRFSHAIRVYISYQLNNLTRNALIIKFSMQELLYLASHTIL